MSTLGSFIWSIADQLRGPYRPNQYGNVILPFTILRRLDCILEPDRETVRDLAAAYENPNRLRIEVKKATGRPFYNTSKYSFVNLLKDADGLEDNLFDYVDRFSADVDVFEYFDFKKEIIALEKAGLLREIVKSFGAVDLHPDFVSNADMGDAFEYIIRKFNEAANETSGDHYTPRDVIRLLVDLLFAEKDADLTEPGIVRTLYDPTAGTGGMLALAEEHLLAQNPDARLSLYGQEYNPQSYAICKSDLLAKGHDRPTSPSATRSPTTPSRAASSTSACPIRRTASTGSSTPRPSPRSVTRRAHTAASPRACRRPRTGRCCSCCTWRTRCAPPRTAAAGSGSS